jgi:hypothetical protein
MLGDKQGTDKGVIVRMFSILFGSLSANNNPAPANHLRYNPLTILDFYSRTGSSTQLLIFSPF